MDASTDALRVRRRIILIIVATVAFVVIIFVAFFLSSRENVVEEKVVIAGLDSCSSGIDSVYTDSLQDIYGYIQGANELNGWETQEKYTSAIRAGSCSQNVFQDEGSGKEYFNTSIILDIPDAQQSYRISYSWAKDSSKIAVDLGYPLISCLQEEELIYGDFKCKETQLIKDNFIDPVINYVPHYSLFYEIKPVASDTGISLRVTIIPSAGDARGNISTAIERYKKDANDYLISKDIDPSSYQMEYDIVYPSIY